MAGLGFRAYDGNHAPHWPFGLDREHPRARDLRLWIPSNAPLIDLSLYGSPVTGVNEATTGIISELNTEAISLDGFNDHLIVPDAPHLDVTAAITILAWVRFPTISGFRAVVGKIQTTSTKSCWLTMNGDRFSFFLSTSGSNQSATVNNNVALTTNTLYRIGATYDGSTVELYLNGALDRTYTPSLTGAIFSSTSQVEIGSILNGGSDLYTGLISDPMIYGRVLSDAEMWDDFSSATRWGLRSQPRRVTYFALAAVGGIPNISLTMAPYIPANRAA